MQARGLFRKEAIGLSEKGCMSQAVHGLFQSLCPMGSPLPGGRWSVAPMGEPINTIQARRAVVKGFFDIGKL